MAVTNIVANNPNADRIRRYRSLANAAARRRTGLFLVEGPQSVRELVQHRPHAIEMLYLAEDAAHRYPEIAAALKPGSRPNQFRVSLATPEVIKSISENSQGVLAVAKVSELSFGQPFTVPNISDARLITILHNVRDPGNAGTVIRASDAMGSDLAILTGDSVEVTNPKVVRSSAGSLFHGPVVAEKSLPDVVKSLRESRWQVFAAAGNGAVELTDPALNLARPTAWIFGNEAWGLLPDDAALADQVVRIPMYGAAESLNLATAAAICLFATAAAQHA